MKYLVHIEPDAERDIEEIMEYLEKQKTGLSSTFLTEYAELLVHIATYAPSVQARQQGYRQVVIGRFKLLLIFLFDGECVRIWRIIHAARNPASRYERD